MIVFILLSVILIVLTRLFSRTVSKQCDSQVCLVGKTALVTGGSAGLGYQIVLDLCKRGCRVIIADKNVNGDIKEAIIQETNNDNITMEHVDLASFKSVRQLAERINRTEEKLDVLINNAGVLFSSNDLTEDGLNLTWQINHFGPFLLTHLLIDLLKKSQSGRIIFTSSEMAFFNNLERFDPGKTDFMNETKNVFHYSNTKCLNIVASDIFAEKLEKHNISSNSCHPGVVRTSIFQSSSVHCRNWADYLSLGALNFLQIFAGTGTKEGAHSSIHLAVAKEVEGISGKYFGQCSPKRKPKLTTNKSFCERIWKLSENVVDLKVDERL
ncbi:unnamed protein product [Phaedon cochleariae]|uniref:Short-chain dehydrogenase/reductase n=1 Tax=Phaedon cochleariae TaxID=80249 RepID=A0A9P0DPG9_PHACE|nr:unnamed protein product [Phaedon cochleariae]